MFKRLTIQIVVFLILASLATVASACPNCKSAVSQDGGGMSMAFAWSIAMMLAIPFSILSAWTIAIRRHVRRKS